MMLAKQQVPLLFNIWLAIEGGNERSELIDGYIDDIRAQATTTLHADICTNLVVALREAIIKSGAPCRASVEGPVVKINDKNGFIPDVFVECNRIDISSTVINPLIVIEVESDSTHSNDHGKKLTGYLSVDSIRHYLIVSPEGCEVMHYKKLPNTARDGDSTLLIMRYDKPDDSIDLEPGLVLALRDVFHGLYDE